MLARYGHLSHPCRPSLHGPEARVLVVALPLGSHQRPRLPEFLRGDPARQELRPVDPALREPALRGPVRHINQEFYRLIIVYLRTTGSKRPSASTRLSETQVWLNTILKICG